MDVSVKKTKIDNIKNGIDFLGYRFCLVNNKLIVKVRNRIKKNFKKKSKQINILIKNEYISKKEINNFIASYKGIMKWGSCNNLYYKVMGEVRC